MTTETAIATVDRKMQAIARAEGYQPTTLDEIEAVAKRLIGSGFFGGRRRDGKTYGLSTVEEAVVVIWKGAELGLSVMQAVDILVPVRGKVGMTAAGMAALIRREGHDLWVEHDPTDPALGALDAPERQYATWALRRREWPEDRVTRASFHLDEASRMGLTSLDQYQKQPQQMVIWRALSRLARRECSDILMGLPALEELQDEPETITPTSVTEEPSPRPTTTAGRFEAALGTRRESSGGPLASPPEHHEGGAGDAGAPAPLEAPDGAGHPAPQPAAEAVQEPEERPEDGPEGERSQIEARLSEAFQQIVEALGGGESLDREAYEALRRRAWALWRANHAAPDSHETLSEVEATLKRVKTTVKRAGLIHAVEMALEDLEDEGGRVPSYDRPHDDCTIKALEARLEDVRHRIDAVKAEGA